MITFSRLGTKGNLGNQLFQIASTIGLSSKNNHPFAFPYWKYRTYFKIPLPEVLPEKSYNLLIEKKYNFHDWQIGEGNYDLQGWLQSEKYFDRDLVKYYFQFRSDLVLELRNSYKHLLSEDAILITVRRGDFVNHPRFFQLDYKYYLLALIKNFPNWEKRKIIFTSDDIAYCQKYFGILPNSFFLKDLPPMEQLILGSQFSNFIISNSTFSWWIAWLGEKKNSQIIRPKSNFRGKYRLENSDIDYYPERWIRFDDREFHIPLKYYKLILMGALENSKLNFIYRYNTFKKYVKNWIHFE